MMAKSWDPHGATPHGIRYFTGSVPMLLVETCEKIRIEEAGEARNLEVGDSFMGAPVQDILRKSKKEVLGWEIHVQRSPEETETLEVNPDKVIAFSRRSVTDSDFLAEDLEDCPNWNSDDDSEEEE